MCAGEVVGPEMTWASTPENHTEPVHAHLLLLFTQEHFLPLKRSPKMWSMTTRKMAFRVSPPSAKQEFRSGKGSFFRGDEGGPKLVQQSPRLSLYLWCDALGSKDCRANCFVLAHSGQQYP